MKRLPWQTYIHLNFLRPPAVEVFLIALAETDADAFLIGGDIGEAPDLLLEIAGTSAPRAMQAVLSLPNEVKRASWLRRERYRNWRLTLTKLNLS
jgi:hypothetical protein